MTTARRARVFQIPRTDLWAVLLTSEGGGQDIALYYLWSDAMALAIGWTSKRNLGATR